MKPCDQLGFFAHRRLYCFQIILLDVILYHFAYLGELLLISVKGSALVTFTLDSSPYLMQIFRDLLAFRINHIPTVNTVTVLPCSVCSLGRQFIAEEVSLTGRSHFTAVHLSWQLLDLFKIVGIIC